MWTKFVEVESKEMDEEQSKSTEKDLEFRGMQQQLREAQHLIDRFFQEYSELKRKLAEKSPKAQTP
jgi:hypothetical protein